MEDIIERGTGLDMKTFMYLFDHNDDVTVDKNYLIRILQKLRSLEKISPDHLAERDIPDTIKYLTSDIPK